MSKNSIASAWRFVSPHKVSFLGLVALTVVAGGLMAVGDPLALKTLIDSLERGDLKGFGVLVGVIVGLATVVHLLGYRAALIGKRLQNAIHGDLTSAMCRAFYSQPFVKVAKFGDSYHVSRLHEESREISKSAAVLVSLLTCSVQLIVALAVALFFSWTVTLTLLVIVPALVYLSRKYGSRIAETQSLKHEAEAEFKSTLGRVIASYRNVHSFNLLAIVGERVRGAIRKSLELGYQNVNLGAKYGAFSGLYFSYAELTVIVVAGMQVVAGNLSIGGLFGFMRAYQIVMSQVNGLSGLVPTFARLRAAIDRYDTYLNQMQPEDDMANQTSIDPDALVVTEGISLCWDRSEVVSGVSLHLRRAESLLIHGANGSGKSTIAMFMAGFLTPDSGRWQRPQVQRVSASFADGGLMPGSVCDSFAGLQISPEASARCRAVVQSLELEQLMDVEPNELSRGQAAKVQVALALAKEADMYVLDEPLANVDQESKQAVADSIRRFTAGKALVVITHGDEQMFGRFDRTLLVGKRPLAVIDAAANHVGAVRVA